MTALLVFVRLLHEASLMVLFGSAVLLALLSARIPELALESRHLMLSRRAAALAALLSASAWLALTVSGAESGLSGQLLLPRFLLLLALPIAVWRGRVRPTAILSGLLLCLIAISGHTADASPFGFRIIGATSDGLHLMTGGYWIGGLCVLASLLSQRGAAPRRGAAISLFAEWGMIAVALLVMTGMINASMVLLGTPGHDAPTYLLVLGAKLLLVTVMIGLALVNQYRLLPGLGRDDNAVRMKKHVVWELGLGLIVIGLAVSLAVLPPTIQ